MKRSRTLTIVLGLVGLGVLVGGGLLAAVVLPPYLFHRPASSYSFSACLQGKPLGYFSIVADQNGFNQSRTTGRYPIIEVSTLSTATNILFCNRDTTQSFGLAIEHYFIQGAVAKPQTALLLSFKPQVAGNFTFYSQLTTTVDPFTHGTLMVIAGLIR